MSKATQLRFYDIADIFLDDERVMAWAIFEFCNVEDTAEKIYRDLLACRYVGWIDRIELIADELKHLELKEWCLQKQFDLDMMNDSFWSIGDSRVIESNGWKLCPGGNQEEEE